MNDKTNIIRLTLAGLYTLFNHLSNEENSHKVSHFIYFKEKVHTIFKPTTQIR
jgi:hypothetical protein